MPATLQDITITGVAEPPPKQTFPVLEPVTRRLTVAGGVQDGCISVIENPSLDGYIGLILARHYSEARRMPVRFTDVLHIRFNSELNSAGVDHFNEVISDMERATMDYYFVTADSGRSLPAQSIMQYKVCFIRPEVYDTLSNVFNAARGNADRVRMALGKVYKIFAANKIFCLKEGALELPESYARLRMP